MQRQGKLVFVITSNNKVDIRSGCTGFSCVLRVASGVRKIIDYQFCSTILSTNYRLIIDFSILYRLILSTSIFRIFCTEIDLEPDCQPNQTFTLRSLLISECGLMKKLKWGSVYLFIANSLYFVVHLDGYMQRILKTLKIID